MNNILFKSIRLGSLNIINNHITPKWARHFSKHSINR